MTERQKRRAEARTQAKKENPEAARAAISTPISIPTPTAKPEIMPTPSNQISEAQLAANRANAQLSTGPTSAEGLEISSRNNFRHGLTQPEGELILLDSESKDEFEKRRAGFQREWNPSTQTEQDLVDRLATSQWLRRRAMKLQTGFLAADGQILDTKKFALYSRYANQHERSFNRALSDLMRLRSLQLRERNGFESQKRKDELHAFKIKAAKARELKNKMAVHEAVLRVTTAQINLHNAGSAENFPMDAEVDEFLSESVAN
jgi:hypothetical protein